MRVPAVAKAQAPLQLRYRVADYLRRPRWGVTVNLNHFPLAPIPEIARNLGWVIPADFKFDGTADGAVGYSMPEGSPRMDGALNLSNSTLIVAGAPPLHIAGGRAAGFRAARSRWKRRKSPMRAMRRRRFRVDWDVASQQTECRAFERRHGDRVVAPADFAWREFRCWATRLPAHGKAICATTRQAGWAGAINLEDADIPFEAFAEPLHVDFGGCDDRCAPGWSMKRVDLIGRRYRRAGRISVRCARGASA